MRNSALGAMPMVRFSASAAALAVALATAPACAQVQWRLPSAYPADNFHSENLAAFAKDVGEVTGGKLAIKVYPNASLFPAPAIKSAVRIGQAAGCPHEHAEVALGRESRLERRPIEAETLEQLDADVDPPIGLLHQQPGQDRIIAKE